MWIDWDFLPCSVSESNNKLNFVKSSWVCLNKLAGEYWEVPDASMGPWGRAPPFSSSLNPPCMCHCNSTAWRQHCRVSLHKHNRSSAQPECGHFSLGAVGRLLWQQLAHCSVKVTCDDSSSFLSLPWFFPFCSIVHSLPSSGAGAECLSCATAELWLCQQHSVPQQHCLLTSSTLCAPAAALSWLVCDRGCEYHPYWVAPAGGMQRSPRCNISILHG